MRYLLFVAMAFALGGEAQAQRLYYQSCAIYARDNPDGQAKYEACKRNNAKFREQEKRESEKRTNGNRSSGRKGKTQPR